MADETTGDTVSREAHDRIRQERDQFKAKLEELQTTVADMGTERIAHDFLREQGIADPSRWANVFLPHLRGQEPDGIRTKLDELVSGLPRATEPAPPEPPKPSPPPVPAAASPNPATPGQPVPPEIPTYSQYTKANPQASWREVAAAMARGEVAAQPENRSAQAAQAANAQRT